MSDSSSPGFWGTIVDWINPFSSQVPGDPFGGNVAQPVVDAVDTIEGIGNDISSVGDFLSWIAWIFNPLNILRAVEVLAGLIMGAVGIKLLMPKGGGLESGPATIRKAAQGVASSPVGRAAASTSVAGRARTSRARRAGTRAGNRGARAQDYRREYEKAERSARTNAAKKKTSGRSRGRRARNDDDKPPF